ncbi:MAG TPA: dUTPase [Nitrososphaeraceae archaeon]|jgi:dimeric dUTPase (all-alpha-NTP-PPase superfamily)
MTRKFQSSNEDKLELLFRKQLELTRKMRNVNNKMSSIYKKKEVFRGYRVFMLSTALIHEAIELQRETNWKWWKHDSIASLENCQQELIDIWHFVIQLSIELKLDPSGLVEKYTVKHDRNVQRQKEGY